MFDLASTINWRNGGRACVNDFMVQKRAAWSMPAW